MDIVFLLGGGWRSQAWVREGGRARGVAAHVVHTHTIATTEVVTFRRDGNTPEVTTVITTVQEAGVLPQ